MRIPCRKIVTLQDRSLRIAGPVGPFGRSIVVALLVLLTVSALLPGRAAAAHGRSDPGGMVKIDQTNTSCSPQVTAGTFKKIYDPSVGESGPWYFNDHTFVRDRATGTWHLFGITHAEPADPFNEVNFGHATAQSLTQSPWQKQPYALTARQDLGETVLWAPYVLFHGGTYYMYYAAGGSDMTKWKINLATSTDLYHWTRSPANPMVVDGYQIRDPYVMRVHGKWVMYYDATSDPTGGNHVVAYATSDDLVHWSGRGGIAFRDPSVGTVAGPTESPFVVRHGAYYYLFIGPRGGYVGTDVFRSTDPFHWDLQDKAGHIQSHAAEVVQDVDGSWYVSSDGWGQGGVYLAPLSWDTPVTCSVVTTPYYRAVITTAPETAIDSLAVDPSGSGQAYRQVMGNSFRGTVPYAGVGNFGDTDRPGAAAGVTLSSDKRQLTLTGIPIGHQPITVDWTFNFADQTFDQTFTWHVSGQTTAPVWEAGWNWDTTLPRLGDSANLNRPTGDVHGFPYWTLAGDDGISLVAAYKSGSAWSEDNRWYNPDYGNVAWQPHWQPGGKPLPPGDYPGGTWRIGASPRAADTAYADQLYAQLNAPPTPPPAATPELGSGELLATGLVPVLVALLYRRRRRRIAAWEDGATARG